MPRDAQSTGDGGDDDDDEADAEGGGTAAGGPAELVDETLSASGRYGV